MSTLSSILLEERFLPAFATTEWVGDHPRFVRCGTPMSFGTYESVLAIYDERGFPWVMYDTDGRLRSLVLRTSRFCGFGLSPGAPVPHSGDKLFFLEKILPAHCPAEPAKEG